MNKTFAESVNEALSLAMEIDEKVVACGLGISDPKAIFGTTSGLEEKYGKDRVFDMPVSENALTGVAVGMAIGGYKSILTHQRLDFSIVSMDQIVNSAAKWFYMFGGRTPIPIVIRMIIGRGWGQGPTHAQALHSWFAHIPGLKVVMPSNAYDAKGLLLESIFDPNPVIFLEHRWLHNSIGIVPNGDYRVPIDKSKIVSKGSDITIVSLSIMTPVAMTVNKILAEKNISLEVIDLISIRPIDWDTIFSSVKKTGKLMVLDISHPRASVASDIIANTSSRLFKFLKEAPVSICLPDHCIPTSYSLTEDFYPSVSKVMEEVLKLAKIQTSNVIFNETNKHDIPGDWFKGPF